MTPFHKVLTKVNLSAARSYRGVEIRLHAFLALTTESIDGFMLQPLYTWYKKASSTHVTGGQVGPRVRLNMVKVKLSLSKRSRHMRKCRYSSTHLNLGTGSSGQLHESVALPQGKGPRYPFNSEMGGPQSLSGGFRVDETTMLISGIELAHGGQSKDSSFTGPRIQAVQPAATHITDSAIPAVHRSPHSSYVPVQVHSLFRYANSEKQQ